MMSAFKISPTFLDSFEYYQSEYGATDEKRQEIIDRLRGVPILPNQSMQFGIEFEQAVCDFLDEKKTIPIPAENSYDDAVLEIAAIVGGARRQVYVDYPLSKAITLHGYIDFLQPDFAYDTKTTKGYEVGKYLKNMQHRAYLAGLRDQKIESFAYLVYDYSQREVFIEEYYWRDSIVGELRGVVDRFFAYLEIDEEMKEAFYAKQEKVAA